MKAKTKWLRRFGWIVCCAMMTALLGMTVYAEEEGVEINATNFPNVAFRKFVKSYDTDGNDVLSAYEISKVTSINCRGYNISNLKGIEHFKMLKELDCSSNYLTSLDVSQNKELVNLNCFSNQLTSLDVSCNRALEYLECCRNQITSLDVSKNVTLEKLNCTDNQLTNLDVSQNTELAYLYCSSNQLTELDVSRNTALVYLYCSNNQLTGLDVSHNTALAELYCPSNQLTKLDVSQNTALTYLRCTNNQLTSLDVSHNLRLKYLIYKNNQREVETDNDGLFDLSTLPGFDVSKASNWVGGTINGNYLHFDSDIVTYSYDCSNSKFPNETFRLCLNSARTEINEINFPDVAFREIVESYDIDGNDVLSAYEISKVVCIVCPYSEISNLKGIEYFPMLEELYCFDNQLTSLDVSLNTELRYLYCYNNQLTDLDLSQNTCLEILDCSNNLMTSLDLSQNTCLEILDCYENQLRSLDVSQNTALRELDCYKNQLSSLDVRWNTALAHMECYENRLTDLNVSWNTCLRELNCYENRLTYLDVSRNTALERLDCSHNQLTSLDVSQNIALEYLNCENNLREVENNSNSLFDLSTLPGFDLSKASDWVGGTITGNYLHFDNNIVTYSYECGNIRFDKETFKLCSSSAQTEINATNFPDVAFRKIVKSYDTDGNDVISAYEIGEVKSIDCSWKNISSLKGIENFDMLVELDCSHNQLESLDMSQNTMLMELDCSHNQLAGLDMSQNTVLEELYCSHNQLESLDMSQNTVLVELDCSNNRLAGLDMSQNTMLEELDCSSNRLTSLDVSQNLNLRNLGYEDNLREVETDNDSLFDLSTLPKFDLSKASDWVGGTIIGNYLHFDNDIVTYSYDCANSRFNKETFMLCLNSARIEINESNFPDDKFREIVKSYDIDRNNVFSVYEIGKVTSINCHFNVVSDSNKISNLKGIECFAMLEELDCSNNGLTSLDVSQNTALMVLDCSSNQLTNLDVSQNTALARLDCSRNQLTSLDVSQNTALEELNCLFNRLTGLDASQNTALRSLDCFSNQLSSLDVSQNTALEALDCAFNQLSSLDVSQNTALVNLDCSYNVSA